MYKMSALERLKINNNRLEGRLHHDINGLTSITHMDFSRNRFHGNLPSEIGHLQVRHLQHHKIQVTISRQNLKAMFLNENDFIGVVPYSFALCVNLTSFVISHTQIQVPLRLEYQQLKSEELQAIHQRLPRTDIAVPGCVGQPTVFIDGQSRTCVSVGNNAHSFDERLARFSQQHYGTYGKLPPLHVRNNRHNPVDPNDPMQGDGITLDFTVVTTHPMAMSPPCLLHRLREEFQQWKLKQKRMQKQNAVKTQLAATITECYKREQHQRSVRIKNDPGNLSYDANQQLQSGSHRVRTWPGSSTTHFPVFLQQSADVLMAQYSEIEVINEQRAQIALESELQTHLKHLIALHVQKN